MPIFVIVYFRLVAISSLCFVILSAAKDLEVCTTIHRLRDLEILHYVQNDVVSVCIIARLMLYSVIARRASPDVAISSQPTIDNVDSVLSLRRFFTTFRMTLLVCLCVCVIARRALPDVAISSLCFCPERSEGSMG